QTQANGFIFSIGNFTTYTPNNNNRTAFNHNQVGSFLFRSMGSAGATLYSLVDPSPNIWQQYRGVDNTTQARIYRNGNQVNTGNSSVYNINPSSPLMLGGNINNWNSSTYSGSNMEVAEMLFFNIEHNDSI